MKKLIIAYLFTITNIFAAPPTYFNGELQTNTYIQNIKAPNYQTTPIGGIDRRLETGNLNELQNPSFEHVTVATGWTISNATSSSSTTRIEGSKSLSLALTGALSLSQSSTINAAQKSGVQMVASIWVNSSDVSDLQLCSLKNGSEDKCTVTGGYVQGSGWRQLTVSFLGDSTSNGLKLKSTDTTGTVLVDQAYVGIGSPIVDFTPDMVFSAKVSLSGLVSDENTDFINGNASVSSAVYTITFNAGIFTVAPNCVATINNNPGSQRIVAAASVSSTQVVFNTFNAASAAGLDFVFTCQKQGADYKTSKAYVASSSDTDWTPCTFSTLAWQGLGTVTNTSLECRRSGNSLRIRGRFEAGTVSASEGRIPLPSNFGSITTKTTNSNIIGGLIMRGAGATDVLHNIIIQSGVSYLNFSNSLVNTGNNPVTIANGNTFATNDTVFIPEQSIAIQGWTDSGVIVGSFQGYNETPGTSRVEMFSFSFGTTNINTACSASPCSYLDQIGNNVTSVTKGGGSGDYTVNFAKTFSKIRCTANAINPGVDALLIYGGSGVLACNNCNSVFMQTVSRSAGASTNGAATVQCQGIPQ